MNNLVTLHFPTRSGAVPDRRVIHPGRRYDLISPDSALAEYLDADHDQRTGIVGACRLSVDSAEIEPVDSSARPLRCKTAGEF